MVRYLDTVDKLSGNTPEVAPSLIMTFKSYYVIVDRIISASQYNTDGATQLMPPELKLVPETQPIREGHSIWTTR